MPFAAVALLALQKGLLPSFPSGWQSVPPAPIEFADAILTVPSASANGFSATGAWIENPPVERDLTLTVRLRGAKGGGPVQINAFAYDSAMKLLKPSSVTIPTQPERWTEGRSTFIAPPGTTKISIWIINATKANLEVQEPRLNVGAPHLVGLNGSGLLLASAGTEVAGKSGTVLFPIPGPTSESAPVSFALHSEPASALKGYVVRRRENGDNWICEARVEPPIGGTAKLRWESAIAVRDQVEAALPKRAIEAPKEVEVFLDASPVVQSDDSEIKAKSAELRGDGLDVEAFVRRTIAFTSANQGTGKPFASLDASTALGCGGSCTSRANLGAALLRAGGVPARTVSHLPTFADGSPLYEHWFVEYWHPGVGWIRAETTMGEFRPKASGFTSLATASLADEKRTGQAGQRGWIMPGAAWMSGIQGAGDLHSAGDESSALTNWCRPIRRLAIDDGFLRTARAAWPRLAQGHPELEAVALTGSSLALTTALKRL